MWLQGKIYFFTNESWNRLTFSLEYITQLLKSEEIDKFDRAIRVGKFLESYYPGSHVLFLFLGNYKINLPE